MYLHWRQNSTSEADDPGIRWPKKALNYMNQKDVQKSERPAHIPFSPRHLRYRSDADQLDMLTITFKT